MVPVVPVGGVDALVLNENRWRVCGACVWLILVGLWLWCSLVARSCPCRVLQLLRTHAAMIRL